MFRWIAGRDTIYGESRPGKSGGGGRSRRGPPPASGRRLRGAGDRARARTLRGPRGPLREGVRLASRTPRLRASLRRDIRMVGFRDRVRVWGRLRRRPCLGGRAAGGGVLLSLAGGLRGVAQGGRRPVRHEYFVFVEESGG